ncbi:hypothetical protein L3X38_042772 [Prunus dulcis]|uniref:Uncharacterized protein n=1 Tax=Prunus dulcis TaxID=3755 RepID=A0AAD4YLI3_PRUDU|nr:hypothetical protein L3X38_042772 [Prunus dulcis]
MWDFVQVVVVATRVLEIRFGSWELRQLGRNGKGGLVSSARQGWIGALCEALIVFAQPLPNDKGGLVSSARAGSPSAGAPWLLGLPFGRSSVAVWVESSSSSARLAGSNFCFEGLRQARVLEYFVSLFTTFGEK